MTTINLTDVRQQLYDRIAEGHPKLTFDDVARLDPRFALSFAADPHLQSVSQLVSAAMALGYHGEHAGREQEQAFEDALLAVLAPHFESPLERIMDALHNCSEFKLTCPDQYGDWTAEFAYDRCHFEGRGDTPEAALVEALVDLQMADHYYAGGEQLTPEQMTEWLHGAYRTHLDLTPEHEYRGEYLKPKAFPAAAPDAPAPARDDGAAKRGMIETARAIVQQVSGPPRPLSLDDLPARINDLLRRADAPFLLGDSVRKRPGGGEWRGMVVGLYLASKTPLGFAVESVREEGSVQIYPAKALEGWQGE